MVLGMLNSTEIKEGIITKVAPKMALQLQPNLQVGQEFWAVLVAYATPVN